MSRPLSPLWLGLVGLSAACGGSSEPERTHAGAGGHAPCERCLPSDAGAATGGDAGAAGDAGELAGTANDAGDAGSAGAAGAANGSSDGVAIAEVSFWQTLRIPLELGGSSVAANAPIISAKAGILRVYVEPDPKFRTRALSAVLEFGVGSALTSFDSTKLVMRSSSHAEFASTFNFPLTPEQVAPGTSYAVTVSDPGSGEVFDRFPRTEHSPLAAASALGNRLDLVVVPFVVGGIVPDVSAPTLSTFRTRVLAMYPVADISITVHPPVTSAIEVGPEQGWDALLDALYAQRAADAPAASVFYYGLFTPTKTFDDYCVTDCTVGYSIVADADDVESRGSLGLGIFSDGSNRDAPDTMAHELGHALGRDHAPCDVSKQDSGPFPYSGGKIGVWGFDAPHHALLDPALYGDVMGYCTPDWISDFTYSGLFERISLVNAEISAKALGPEPATGAYRRVLLASNGVLSWGSRSTPRREPNGSRRELTLLGNGSVVLGKLSVVFRPFADSPGGFLLLPESALAASVRALRVGNAELALPTR